MIKANAMKAVALAAGLAINWVLPPGWTMLLAAVLVTLLIGFFAYTIAHPSSQFFIRVVNRLATDEPIVALTFDDGPDPVYTPQILDVLRAHGARATFFVVGERAASHPDLIRRMHREGHSVGTHTQHHLVRFHLLGPAYVRREIEAAVEVVAGILPERPTLFRPPQGLRTPFLATAWRRMRSDLTCVTWSVRGLDSRPTTAGAIVARVGNRLSPGAIVTLHDGTGLGGGKDREPTIAALATILTECEARGLRCVALSEVGAAEARHDRFRFAAEREPARSEGSPCGVS